MVLCRGQSEWSSWSINTDDVLQHSICAAAGVCGTSCATHGAKALAGPTRGHLACSQVVPTNEGRAPWDLSLCHLRPTTTMLSCTCRSGCSNRLAKLFIIQTKHPAKSSELTALLLTLLCLQKQMQTQLLNNHTPNGDQQQVLLVPVLQHAPGEGRLTNF